MGAPRFTVKVNNKDGSKRTFTNYAGESVSDKYERIGVLFENKFGGFDFVLDRPVKLDPAQVYISVFSNARDRGERADQRDDLGF